MPLNPFTGEFEGYDSPSTQAGMGMAAMSASGMDVPLAFRMLEQSPGIATAMGFSAFRGSNTLLRGGSKPSLFSTTGTSKDYFRSGRARSTTRAPFLRPALRNNMLRPRNFTQFTDLSVFGDSQYRRYTPFGAAGMLGNNAAGRGIASKMGINLAENESAFGPGLFSGISAGVRIDRMEAKAVARIKNGKDANKIFSKLSRVDENITTLAKMNVPDMMGASSSKQVIATARAASPKVGMGATAQQRLAQARAYHSAVPNAMSALISEANTAGAVGARGNLMASSMAGGVTKFVGGYTRGTLGFGGAGGLLGRAADGAKAAEGQFAKAFTSAFGDDGLKIGNQIVKSGDEAIGFLRSTGGGKFFSQLGARNTAKLATSGGAKFVAARAGALAIPGLNVVAAASLVYDLGKMAGEVVKSGIELARDAGKSLQGTIAKPTFGMGYKDTEAAATSRSRGVMAIQNSRLNMRSLLGSEAAMMAAHYG